MTPREFTAAPQGRVEIDGHMRCFGDIFAITPRRPWYLNHKLAKGNDSGSWVIRSSNGVASWDGMLFAGDGIMGYACFAENIMDKAQAFSPTLALIP